jgi:flagellar hook-basal body complex protein FliE
MADKQVQIESSVDTLLNIANSSKPSECGNCAELEQQLLQALNELSSVQLTVDLLSTEHKHKQDEPTSDIVRNDQWTRVIVKKSLKS